MKNVLFLFSFWWSGQGHRAVTSVCLAIILSFFKVQSITDISSQTLWNKDKNDSLNYVNCNDSTVGLVVNKPDF